MSSKRAFDLAVSAVGLLLLSPLLCAIAVLVKLQDGEGIFFRQERIGKAGRPFGMWKFRTMVAHASFLGPAITVGDDSRVTQIGRVLRRYKLDELPQLFNVLKGEMSMVGPRPEVPKYVAMYTDTQRAVLDLKPGVTDKASIVYVDEATLLARHADFERFYIEHLIPAKIRINLEYAAQATLAGDIGVLLQTIFSAVPSGAKSAISTARLQRNLP